MAHTTEEVFGVSDPSAKVEIDAALWKEVCFLVEGIAVMDTFRQSHPPLQAKFNELARRIDKEVTNKSK